MRIGLLPLVLVSCMTAVVSATPTSGQEVLDRKINPGKVFDLTLPLDQVAEGYRAMDERRAIKTLLLSVDQGVMCKHTR